MSIVLITGSSGLVGSESVNFFCKKGFDVIGIDNNYSVNIKQNDEKDNNIIQGIFNLKYIAIFTKCTNLCEKVEIYLKQEYPLILCYKIANLGTIQLALSPEVNNTT